MNKMRSLVCVCLFVLVCGAFAKNKKDDHKVKIAVYYESLCPDSKKFITSQLAPVWRDFKGVIKVKLVPYGKSTHEKVNGKWEFTCHHGPDECYGNKIQSCILKDKSLADTEKMELVVCLMSQASPDKALDTCVGQPQQAALRACAGAERGAALLAQAGDKTAAVARPLSFVPTVIINEKFDQSVQDEAFKNLKSVVCRVADPKPAVC
ncbi:GILT-like protein 1 isoform X2 [Plodia interpunctella]|uniref:GILT-like protein 1 isoform X2 n=1 Tax=Plodia interpunctella TaxID=58824 RepID=UPI002368511D|nr:GILT-like protein 1 isoform X2 [Plodia interpunctella]